MQTTGTSATLGERLATTRRKRPFWGHLVGIMECAGMTLAVQIPE